MANALVALNYIKQPDGTYRLHFPINTTNEVYYDIDNNVTLKKYLSTITPGGIMHTVETDEDRLALTKATVKLMDVVKVIGDKNALYYVTDLEKLGTEEGFTPFVDPDKFVSKENGSSEGGTTIVNGAFVGESPIDEVTYGDMIIDLPSGIEDSNISIDMTVKNTNMIDFEYVSDRSVEIFPEQNVYTKTLRSCLSPNGMYLYVEVSDGINGKGIMYKVAGTKLTYMNTLMTFTDLTAVRSCTFTNDSRCILIATESGIIVGYRSADESVFIYNNTPIITDFIESIHNLVGKDIILGIKQGASTKTAVSMTIAIEYTDSVPTITLTDNTSEYFQQLPPIAYDLTGLVVAPNGRCFAYVLSGTHSSLYLYESITNGIAYRGAFSLQSFKIQDIKFNSTGTMLGACSNTNGIYLYNMGNLSSVTTTMANLVVENGGNFQTCAFTYGSEAFVALGYNELTVSGGAKAYRRSLAIFDIGSSNIRLNRNSASPSFVAGITEFTDILVSPISNCGYVIHNGFNNITPFTSNGATLLNIESQNGDAFPSPYISLSDDGAYCASVLAFGYGRYGTIDFYSLKPDGSVLKINSTAITLSANGNTVTAMTPVINSCKWVDNNFIVSHSFLDGEGVITNRLVIHKVNTSANTVSSSISNTNGTSVTKFFVSDFFGSTAWLACTTGINTIGMFTLTKTSDGTTVGSIGYSAGWAPNATIIDAAFYNRYLVVLYNAYPYIKILKYQVGNNGYNVPETTYNADLALPVAPTSVQIDKSSKRMIITYNEAPYVEVFNFEDVGNDLDHIVHRVDETHIGIPEVPIHWGKLLHDNRYILFCNNGTPKQYYLGTFSGNKIAIVKSGKLDDAIVNPSSTRPEFSVSNNLFIDTDNTRPYVHIFKTSEVLATSAIKIQGKVDSASKTWKNALIETTNAANIDNIYLSYNSETGRACIVIKPINDSWFNGYVSIDKITFQGSTTVNGDYEISFGDFLTDGDYTDLYEYIKSVEGSVEDINNRSVVTKDVIENVEITTDGWVNKLDTLGYYVYTIKSDLIKSTSTVMMDVIGVLGAEIANNASVISNTTEYNGYSEIYAVDLPTGSFFVNITIIN